jgi:hypothetical protein
MYSGKIAVPPGGGGIVNIITGIGGIRENIERGVKEWLEREIGVKVNVKGAF